MITRLKTAMFDDAEILADRLYAMMANLRITSLLAEVGLLDAGPVSAVRLPTCIRAPTSPISA